MFLTHSIPVLLSHRRILRLYTMNALAIKCLVSIYMGMHKIFPGKDPDAQECQTNCNY